MTPADTPHSSPTSGDISPLPPRLLALLLRLQFDINCVSSVAIEVPGLRPLAESMQRV